MNTVIYKFNQLNIFEDMFDTHLKYLYGRQWYGFPSTSEVPLNTLRPRQNGRHFVDDIFKCILLNENVWIPNKISMKFVPKGPINNIPSLVQIMAWRRPGDKPLSEPMMVSSLTHICVTRPQWVKITCKYSKLFIVHEQQKPCAYLWYVVYSQSLQFIAYPLTSNTIKIAYQD